MQKYAWLTDIHLEFLSNYEISSFVNMLSCNELSGIFITGDISDSGNLISHLRLFGEKIRIPVFFVLGNHDYYGSDIATVESRVEEIVSQFTNLIWLPNAGVVKLTNKTCLIGHGGWVDGRFGNYNCSRVILNDYLKIKNFLGLGKTRRLELLNELADNAANYIRETLHHALNLCSNVIMLTHAPPFKEVCWYQGKESDDNHLPHFASKVMGETVRDVMHEHKGKNLTIYCGHTHNERSVKIMPNLVIKAGRATYGAPETQDIIQVTS